MAYQVGPASRSIIAAVNLSITMSKVIVAVTVALNGASLGLSMVIFTTESEVLNCGTC